MSLRGRRWVALGIILAVVMVAACVRFNKFYNATRDFDEAERLRNRRDPSGRPSATEIKKYEGCITRCQEIIREHPESGFVDDCMFLIGKSLLRQAEYTKAERWLERVTDEYPHSSHAEESAFLLATLARLDGRSSMAVSRLDRFLAQYPGSKWRGAAVLELVMSLVSAGRTDSALVVGRGALDGGGLGGAEDRLRFEVGQLLLEAGDWEAADRMFAGAAEGRDRSLRFEAALLRGSALEVGGRSEEAAELYTRLEGDARADSQIAKAGLALAAVYLARGQPDEAVGKLTEIVEFFPSTPQASEAHYRLGRVYVSRYGDLEKAEEQFSKASRGRRTAEGARAALESTKQLKELRETLADSASAGLWLRAAECYLFSLDVSESAAVCYGRAASSGDSMLSPRAFLALAWLLEQEGEDAEARNALQDLVTTYPTSSQAAAARLLLDAPAPDPPDTAVDYGFLYAEGERALLDGHHQVAAELFDDVAATATDEGWAAKARFAAAWTLQEKLGRTGEALRRYEDLVELFPESPYGREAAFRLGVSVDDTTEADSVSAPQAPGVIIARCDTSGFGSLRTARVRVRVLPDGRAAEVDVQEGSGSLTCDEEVQEAARRTRYVAARSGKTAVEGWWEGVVEVHPLYTEQPPEIAVLEPQESELDSLPIFTVYNSPTYPPGLLVLAEGEKVTLTLELDERGGITSTRIEQAPEAIRQIVLQTVAGWRFRPAYRDGLTAPSKISISFVVEGGRR